MNSNNCAFEKYKTNLIFEPSININRASLLNTLMMENEHCVEKLMANEKIKRKEFQSVSHIFLSNTTNHTYVFEPNLVSTKTKFRKTKRCPKRKLSFYVVPTVFF